MAKTVRYQVLKPAFVNGSLIDPKGRKDVFVMADEGLEGSALKLAPERPARKPRETGVNPVDAGDGANPAGSKPVDAGDPAGDNPTTE